MGLSNKTGWRVGTCQRATQGSRPKAAPSVKARSIKRIKWQTWQYREGKRKTYVGRVAVRPCTPVPTVAGVLLPLNCAQWTLVSVIQGFWFRSPDLATLWPSRQTRNPCYTPRGIIPKRATLIHRMNKIPQAVSQHPMVIRTRMKKEVLFNLHKITLGKGTLPWTIYFHLYKHLIKNSCPFNQWCSFIKEKVEARTTLFIQNYLFNIVKKTNFF